MNQGNKVRKHRKLPSLHPVRLWKRITKRWMVKLLCLLMAFVVWQGIRENTNFEVVVKEIPLTVRAGDGCAVLDQSGDVVSVRFRGSREDISFISRDQVSIEIDVQGRPGRLRQSVKLLPHHVKTLSRAHAVRFYPSVITVTMDREVERLLPVKAVFEGTLPEGIQMKKAICNPASVRLRGAEQLLLSLEQVRTAPLSLDGRSQSFKTHVAVSSNGQPWIADPELVEVEMELVEEVDTRRIEKSLVRPLRASDDSRGVIIRPERVDVILRGSAQRLENIDPREVVLYVDCSALTELAEYEMPVRVHVPPGVQVEGTEPSIVQVVIQNK